MDPAALRLGGLVTGLTSVAADGAVCKQSVMDVHGMTWHCSLPSGWGFGLEGQYSSARWEWRCKCGSSCLELLQQRGREGGGNKRGEAPRAGVASEVASCMTESLDGSTG